MEFMQSETMSSYSREHSVVTVHRSMFMNMEWYMLQRACARFPADRSSIVGCGQGREEAQAWTRTQGRTHILTTSRKGHRL